ncbi:hypothetical protein LX15_001341 [Streptoalloteichus tenebrarius]|uniref:Secreted protein n=1 Tax=Streptoalloteichus tenebrarius (strain ATCC 17920 / DSM 40477 / JCM 4838 / CBS 697.72 / NBRC 16177 / NCIMB 11028 / NRRL B-12390 / A12253. 1 / ISP 5477) TaxID=1933 RepID=A0ABT1HQ62_STRSD|nr:hypothetical protein [Streptoalloteichus tenebrarius]
MAPAMPTRALAAISVVGLVALAARTQASPNPAAPVSSSRRRPMRSPSAPMVTSRPASRNGERSVIHSSSVALGVRAALRAGRARWRAVASRETSRAGSRRTARPSQARRPGGAGPVAVIMRPTLTSVSNNCQ